MTDRDAGTRPLNRDCPGYNGTYGMPTNNVMVSVLASC